MTLTGPDVSRWQGPVNWQAVRDAGHTYAFTKLTDGTAYGYVDYGLTQLAKIKSVGLVPGTYHWLQPGNGAAQANYYVQKLNEAGGVSGVLTAVDVEDDNSGSANPTNTLYEFADEFARLTGGHPLIVYSGQWFWVGHMGNPGGSHLGPLWHSEYETSQAEIDDGPELENYGGWPGVTFWQYTSSGSCPGISGNCDLNIFYGGPAELAALTGGGSVPLPPPPPPTPRREEMLFVDVNSGAYYLGGAGYWVPIGDPVAAEVLSRPNVYGAPEGVNGVQIAALAAQFTGGTTADDEELDALLAQPPADVDEAAIAAAVSQAVNATLTPEAVASNVAAAVVSAVGETVATEVANLLHQRLAS